MVRPTLTISCIYVLIATTVSAAPPPARTVYADTLAREQTVRTSIAATDARPDVLTEVRAVVNAYETFVRRHPASGYSDNALWQAGRLALDAFSRFGEPADKDTGVRLLRKLVHGYPSSKLVAQVPEQLARFDIPVEAPSSADQVRSDAELAERSRDDRPTATSGPMAAVAGRLATIKDIRRSVLPDAVRITIEVDGEVPFHDERIADPSRVFVDLPGTRATAGLADRTLRFESDADVVRQVRVGRHPNNTTRIVLDAAGITSYSVYPLYGPYRLVIDCVRSAPAANLARRSSAKDVASVFPVAPTARPAPPLLLPARRIPAVLLRRLPTVTPRAAALIADATTIPPLPKVPELATVKPIGVPTPPPPMARPTTESATAVATRKTAEPPTTGSPRPSTDPSTAPPKSSNGGFSIARQLGLGVSRIVIDPGHGGHDPGAKGKGVVESELVLDVALRLEKLLQKAAGVEVILTRRTDDFVPLPERTAIANREGADLFLSIHANASPSAQARGIETYFLNFANNLSAAAVAARENAESGQVMGALPDLVRSIALNNKLDESRDFARQVQRTMLDRLRTTNKTIRDLGVKQAPFVVLIGATMPSVLAEISFVTNPQEAKLLKGTAYRQKIAESLFDAIRKYQTSLKNTTAIALQ